MSLILEALKKSEQQRQREKTPSLHSIHQPVAATAQKSAKPWWLLGIFIAACNFAFLGYWFWRQHELAVPVVQTPAAAPKATTQATAKNETPRPPSAAAENEEIKNTPPEFTRISPRESQHVQSAVASAQPVEEISELPDNVRNDLPAMTFSFHVYSESPEQRTIIINDRRMREGDEVSKGLTLQSITADGVVLLFEQHRIHISVLSGW